MLPVSSYCLVDHCAIFLYHTDVLVQPSISIFVFVIDRTLLKPWMGSYWQYIDTCIRPLWDSVILNKELSHVSPCIGRLAALSINDSQLTHLAHQVLAQRNQQSFPSLSDPKFPFGTRKGSQASRCVDNDVGFEKRSFLVYFRALLCDDDVKVLTRVAPKVEHSAGLSCRLS